MSKLLDAAEKAERALTALLPATQGRETKYVQALQAARDELRAAITSAHDEASATKPKPKKQTEYEKEVEAKTEQLRAEMFAALGKLEERELLWLVESARKETVVSIEESQRDLLLSITTQIEPLPKRFRGDRQTREERETRTRERLRSLFKRLDAIDAAGELLGHLSAIGFGLDVAEYLFKRREADKPTVEGERGNAPITKP